MKQTHFNLYKMSKNVLFALTAFSLVACTTTPSEPPKNTEHWATLISEQENLYQIDNKFYRSEQLNIHTIVNLRFFDRNDDKQAFGHTKINLINTPLLTWSISPDEVADILWQIKQYKKNGAVLVHCYHGADRTGLIVASYRVIYQHWDLNEAKREMQQGPYGYHSVWKNIDNFFTQENMAKIKAELDKRSNTTK